MTNKKTLQGSVPPLYRGTEAEKTLGTTGVIKKTHTCPRTRKERDFFTNLCTAVQKRTEPLLALTGGANER